MWSHGEMRATSRGHLCGLHRVVQRRPASNNLRADRANDGDGGNDDQTRDQGVFQNFATLLVTNQLAHEILHDALLWLNASHIPVSSTTAARAPQTFRWR